MKQPSPNKTAIIFVGIQASGKTSFYQKFFPKLAHVSLDELHTRNKERLFITECLERGTSFVVDNTNPTVAARAGYIGQAKAHGFSVWGYYFQSSIAECVKRNASREGKANVPRNAITHTHRILELPSYDEGFDELFYVQIADTGFGVEDWAETEDTSNGI